MVHILMVRKIKRKCAVSLVPRFFIVLTSLAVINYYFWTISRIQYVKRYKPLLPHDNSSMVVDLDCLLRIYERNMLCDAKETLMALSTDNTALFQHGNLLINRVNLTDDPDKDYVIIHYKDGPRAIRRFHIELTTLRYKSANGPIIKIDAYVPYDIPDFVRQYRIGKFLECGTRKVKQRKFFTSLMPRNVPLSFIDDMAEFRDILWNYRMTAFLLFGSLLGWRRECSIIPHTNDVDFAVLAEEYTPKMFKDMTSGKLGSKFEPRSLYGTLANNTIEIKMWVGKITAMDLFVVFSNRTAHWSDVYGARSDSSDGNRERVINPVRFRFPLITSGDLCAGDLRNRLMNVPCNADQLLEASYGKNWDVDKPTHAWYSDRNAETLDITHVSNWQVVEVNILRSV